MSDPTRPVELSLERASELSAELETSFGPYLATVCARTARALETCGYSALAGAFRLAPHGLRG